ncbi:hypothetical protein SRHO_G00029600 [Serrasalmus rhombeus]
MPPRAFSEEGPVCSPHQTGGEVPAPSQPLKSRRRPGSGRRQLRKKLCFFAEWKRNEPHQASCSSTELPHGDVWKGVEVGELGQEAHFPDLGPCWNIGFKQRRNGAEPDRVAPCEASVEQKGRQASRGQTILQATVTKSLHVIQ